MSTTGELELLRDAVARDDWGGCEAWASARLESASLAIAAQSVLGALERDRSRREQERASGGRDGLIETQRRHFLGIARVWELGSRAGTVREVGPGRDHAYGAIVEAGEAPVALAIAATRELVVAADARLAKTARGERQLITVLTSMAYTTYDGAGVGRRFELEPGTIGDVELRSAGAPLWASKWHVERGEALAPWLAEDGVVAVRPAGGRLALAPHVVQLEQAVKNLRRKVWLARQSGATGALLPGAIEQVLDKLELLQGWGWTRELEPLRPETERVVALLLESLAPDALERAISAELGDEMPA